MQRAAIWIASALSSLCLLPQVANADAAQDSQTFFKLLPGIQVLFSVDNGTYRSILFATPTNGDCHGCGARINAVTYNMENGSLVSSQASLAELGSYGKFVQDVSDGDSYVAGAVIYKTSSNRLVAMMDGVSGGMGEFYEYKDIFVMKADSTWSYAGEIPIHEDNGGTDCEYQGSACYSWSGTLTRNKGLVNGWPSFDLHAIGTTIDLSDDSDTSTNPIQAKSATYVFKGNKYVPIYDQ